MSARLEEETNTPFFLLFASEMAGKRSSLYADLDHLRSMFTSVDPQNTGYIGFKELQVLAENNAGMEETMVALVQEKLDRDRDGKVSICNDE